MANFQTQEQWENDSVSQDIFSHTNETSHHRNNNHKKIYIITAVIFTLSLVIILSIYTFARSIEGTWIRQADDNIGAEGMTIEVIKHGGSFEGKVTSDSDSSTKFKKGQIKWFQLKKIGFGVYECYDLCQDEATNNFYYDGTVSTLTVAPGGKSLNLVAPKHSAGANQIWIKQ